MSARFWAGEPGPERSFFNVFDTHLVHSPAIPPPLMSTDDIADPESESFFGSPSDSAGKKKSLAKVNYSQRKLSTFGLQI